ncbi:hypothetical protein ABEV74_11050 [Paenibacillus cisolokensis]|uniref:hypothetical protein n=1 Tax=Paenibacillus cisolokensis TaxID=1658519 RepID=UPI003D282AC2
MAYNTVPILVDKDGKPIPQYYNPETDMFEPLEGSGGAGKFRSISNYEGSPSKQLPPKAVLIAGSDNTNLRVPMVTSLGSQDGVFGSNAVLGTYAEMAAFNGGNWDRWRGNTQSLLLNGVSRTTTTVSADQINHNARGVHIILDVTNAGTGNITLSIEGKDVASGKYYPILTGDAVTTNGTYVYRVYPGITPVEKQAISDVIPRTYRVKVTHNNSDSITYSVSCALIL